MIHFHRAWKYVVNDNPIVYEKSQHDKNIVNYYTICPKLTFYAKGRVKMLFHGFGNITNTV